MAGRKRKLVTEELKAPENASQDVLEASKEVKEESAAKVYVVCLDDPQSFLNLRAGAGLNYKAIAKVPEGAELVSDDDSDGEWKKVTYAGVSGYCLASKLK